MRISAKSSDCHTFAYIKFSLPPYKNIYIYYNFEAICGIPIIETGLCRLIRPCYFLEWILPSVLFLCENRTLPFIHQRLRHYQEKTYIFKN